MKIDTLVTTVNKTKDEILRIVLENNLQGNVIVGNQCGKKGKEIVAGDSFLLMILFSDAVGVSKNRNMLLEASNADYVTFADDDIHFCKGYVQRVSEFIETLTYPQALRFNCRSLNPDRPISQCQRNFRITSFRQVKEFGVCGIFFSRSFLVKSSLFFPEDMGPGTPYFCGEDTFFLVNFLNKRPTFYFRSFEICFTPQSSSTWFRSANVTSLISEGYAYRRSFGLLISLFSGIFHVAKHRRRFPKISILKQYRLFFNGVRFASRKMRRRRDGYGS